MNTGTHPVPMASRLSLALAALLMAVGGTMHAAAFFAKMEAQISAAKLSPFLEGSFKGLWLIDSSTMLCMAVVFAWLALRPQSASRAFIAMLGFVPLGAALLLYAYLGHFFAAHMMIATTFLAWTAAALRGE